MKVAMWRTQPGIVPRNGAPTRRVVATLGRPRKKLSLTPSLRPTPSLRLENGRLATIGIWFVSFALSCDKETSMTERQIDPDTGYQLVKTYQLPPETLYRTFLDADV